jgi:hypothetical protein
MLATSKEVIAAAPDINLTTLAAIKLEFDIRDDNADHYLETQIPRVSAEISDFCHRTFAAQSYKDTFQPWLLHADHYPLSINPLSLNRWRHRGRLQLANWPIVPGSVTVVRDGIALTPADFVIQSGCIQLVLGYMIPGGTVEVTYSAGWQLPGWAPNSLGAPPLPAAVERAALLMILSVRQGGRVGWTDRDPFLRSETVEGAGSLSYSTEPMGGGTGGQTVVGGMSLAVRNLLDQYVIKGPLR